MMVGGNTPSMVREYQIEYATLGNTGLKASRICLGMITFGMPEWHDWVLDEDDTWPMVRKAIQSGINFFPSPTCTRQK